MIKNSWLTAYMLASVLCLTACDKETDRLLANVDNETEQSGTNVGKDGYFTASFSLSGITDDIKSRVVKGSSKEIQALQYLIYQKGSDNIYRYYSRGNVEQFTPVPNAYQSHVWPLTYPINVKGLPYGDYKVVFLGNLDESQFSNQDQGTKLLSNVEGDFDNVRINMPTGGPLAFDESKYNLYYMAVADFSNLNPTPQLVMRRLVTKNTFSRDLIDTNQEVKDLVNSVAKQVAEGQLTTDVVKGVLSTKLTEILKGLTIVTAPITTIVDRLVNVLLGDLVTLLNEALLSQISDLLYETLKADTDGNFSSLNILLNPWAEPVSSVNVIFDYLPQSIGLDRKVYTSLSNKEYKSVSLGSDSNIRQFSLISLGGDMKLNRIMVNDPGVISGALKNLDGILLDGLLVNITTPIRYQPGNNTSYSTTYDLLRLSLADNTIQGEGISLNVDLNKVINVERLTAAIVGDGILAGLLGGVVDDIVKPIVDGLLSENGLLKDLTVYLPDLAIGNIRASGRWGATHNIYDGTIISTEIGETGN